MSSFVLHPTLKKDLVEIADLGLSKLMALPDANPWIVLVPRVDDVKEWFELSEQQQLELVREVSHCSQWLKQSYCADKINIGALGNMVPQLHIHIIARFKNDRCWPGAIWGQNQPPNSKEFSDFQKRLRETYHRIQI